MVTNIHTHVHRFLHTHGNLYTDPVLLYEGDGNRERDVRRSPFGAGAAMGKQTACLVVHVSNARDRVLCHVLL